MNNTEEQMKSAAASQEYYAQCMMSGALRGSGSAGPSSGLGSTGPRSLRDRAKAQLNAAEIRLAIEQDLEAKRTSEILRARSIAIQSAMRLAELVHLLDRNPEVARILELQYDVKG